MRLFFCFLMARLFLLYIGKQPSEYSVLVTAKLTALATIRRYWLPKKKKRKFRKTPTCVPGVDFSTLGTPVGGVHD